MQLKSILAVILVMACVAAGAQNISKTGIVQMRLKSSGPILSKDQVKGYYFFYNLEKVDRKNNNYMLSVYDENLREINSTKIIRSTNFALVDGAFNGEVFAFLFYDIKNKATEMITYDATLKQVGSSIKPVTSKNGQMIFMGVANGADAGHAFLVPVEKQGFLYYTLQDKKSWYDITYFDNALNKKWNKKAVGSSYALEMATEGFQTDTYVGSLITQKKSLSSKDLEVDLLVQRVDDGSVVFQVPMESGPYNVSFSDVFFDSTKQNFVVFGDYYDKKQKEMKAQSLGFIYLTLDLNGKIVGEKRNSWAEDFSRVTPMNEKGKFEGSNTNVLVHDIIRTSDGQIFVVGEQYKKVASGAGIASQILSVAAGAATGYYGGSNASSSQLNIYSLVIFQFNPDYSIAKVHVFEKDKNVVMLPAGATYSSSKMLSYYAKAIGGFDFVFSQLSEDHSTFSVAYINYDREKGSPSGNLLGLVVYTPEKVFSVDKMKLNRKSTDYFVHRAKEGYVLITEYFRKEKRVDTRLEKINF